MAVVVKNRTYKNPFNSSTTNFLCGNVGTFIQHEFDVDVSVMFETSISESLSTPDTSTLKLVSGKKWKDLGFDVGMSITIVTSGYNGTSPTTATMIVNITAIYNDTLLHDGTYDCTMYTVVPGTNSVDTSLRITKVVITSSSALDACNIKYQLIKNTDSQSDSLVSVIDGTETELQVSGLSTLAINDIKSLTGLGYQSGMAIHSAEIKYISNVSGVRTYHFTIDYLINGIYDNLSDLQILQKPDYLNGTESMTDSILVKFFPQLNNPNVFIQNDMSWTRQLGNVGWINENYNGLADTFNVSNVSYSITAGSVSSLIYNQETTITATISGLTNPSDANLKLSYGILWATSDDTKYKSKNTNYLKNLKMNINGNSGFTNSVVSVSAGADTTLKQGYSIDNARIDVTSVDFSVSGSDIIMTLKVICTQDFQDYLEENPDDANYLIWLSIGDQSLNVNESNRVTKVIDINSFEEYVTPAGAFPNFSTNFLRHPHNLFSIGSDTLSSNIEDDVLAKHRIAIQTVFDPFFIEEISFKFEVENTSDGRIFELEKNSVNVSSYPVVSGVQEINYTGSRGFKLASTNEKNLISVVRDSVTDHDDFKYYNLFYGFKIRWEDWIERLGVPTDFYDTTKGKNGFNNDWYDYFTKSGWNIYYSVYLKGIKNGKEIEYRNRIPFIVRDYDSNPNLTKVINTYRNSDDTLLINGSDCIILNNELTRIEVEYELISGVFSQDEYGTICIQVENGAGEMKFRQLSTEVVSEIDCPLLPLSGETYCNISYPAPNKCVLKCLVDSSKLEDATDYVISSKLGCRQIVIDGFVYTTNVNIYNTNETNLIPA
jgi:hypothetical protein